MTSLVSKMADSEGIDGCKGIYSWFTVQYSVLCIVSLFRQTRGYIADKIPVRIIFITAFYVLEYLSKKLMFLSTTIETNNGSSSQN